MWAYWKRVARRAWSDGIAFWNWKEHRARVIVGIVAQTAIFGLILYLGHQEQVFEEIRYWLAFIVVMSLIFCVALLWNFVSAPHRIDRELRGELDKFHQKSSAKRDRHAIGALLKNAVMEGQELVARSEHLTMGPSSKLWQSKALDWFERYDKAINEALPADEAFEFSSSSTIPNRQTTIRDVKDFLYDRVSALRYLTMQYLGEDET